MGGRNRSSSWDDDPLEWFHQKIQQVVGTRQHFFPKSARSQGRDVTTNKLPTATPVARALTLGLNSGTEVHDAVGSLDPISICVTPPSKLDLQPSVESARGLLAAGEIE